MKPQNWLMKQEPEDYSWADLIRDGKTAWTGVRNFQARNNLRGMQCDDLVLFYHSGKEKRVVGLAKVARDAYADPTATEGDWSAVDLAPVRTLPEPVPLTAIKADLELKTMPLVRQSRLSVMPVTSAHLKRILSLGLLDATTPGRPGIAKSAKRHTGA